MSISDYQVKQNRGNNQLSKAQKRLQAKRKGNARRVPKVVEACDKAIEAAKLIREGAMEEAENHIDDLGTSSSLYTWLYGVESGDIVEVVDPHDDRLQGAEGEVFDTYEKDGEEIAMVYLYPPHERNLDIESTRLEIQESDREVSEDFKPEFEEEETVRVTKEGKYEGATGHVVDSERWKGDVFYLVHIYQPHDVVEEFPSGDIERNS